MDDVVAKKAEKLEKEMAKKLKTTAELQGQNDKLREKWLRHYAAAIFITSLDEITIGKIAQDPQFEGIPSKKMKYWAATDNWSAQRRAYFEQIQKRIEKRFGDKLVNERLKILATVSNLVNKGIEGLERNISKIRSYEALLVAVLKAMEYRESLIDKITSQVVPRELVSSEGKPIKQTANLSKAELIKMTQSVLAHRREQQRAIKTGDEEENEEQPIVRQPVRG